MGVYTSDNALHEKVIWEANDRRLSVENFDGENVDELIKIHEYFPPSKFCAIQYVLCIHSLLHAQTHRHKHAYPYIYAHMYVHTYKY